MTNDITFGRAIADERKKAGLSQKQLAERVRREDGEPISPQYLNDIEHDRRSPSSDHMIQALAGTLNVSANWLYYLAGRIPAAMRHGGATAPQVDEWVAAFRKSGPPKRGR